MINGKKIGVVIPTYKVKNHILNVVKNLPDWIDCIIIVDDMCPQGSGKYVENLCNDLRLEFIFNETNQGVGGATINGYRKAKELGCDIAVKMDGDDQMDPSYLRRLICPILAGWADYTKGNRFFHLDALQSMPLLRRIGNLSLTLLTKVSSGFWRVSDPTNGYTAIHTSLLEMISLDRLAKRYFFETSILIHLNIVGAVAIDIPMPARYGTEVSSLRISKVLLQFPFLLVKGLLKRIWWKYYIYNINAASVLFLIGMALVCFGGSFGIYRWFLGSELGETQSAGTVALAMLPTILGVQMLLQAMLLDVVDRAELPLHKALSNNVEAVTTIVKKYQTNERSS